MRHLFFSVIWLKESSIITKKSVLPSQYIVAYFLKENSKFHWIFFLKRLMRLEISLRQKRNAKKLISLPVREREIHDLKNGVLKGINKLSLIKLFEN